MRLFLLAVNFASNQATSDLRSKNPSCPSPGGEFYNRKVTEILRSEFIFL